MSPDRDRTARVEDAPPPPYSETDIYSNPSAASHPSINGDASQTSTSGGEPILTPPASPIAGSYFETRPVPHPSITSSATAQLVHIVIVGPDTLPDDVPYPTSFADRDVTEQDWATFRNYLLPDHMARENDALVDRKLREEEDGTASGSGKSHAEAQLGRIHSSSESAGGLENRMEAAALRSHAVTTVQEWNTEFFQPRGVTIRLDSADQQQQESRTAGSGSEAMPGSWYEDGVDEGEGQQQYQQQARGGWRRHLDRVKVSDNMLRIGDNFVADVNGLKIGGLVMDGHGIRMDGSQPQPARRFGGPVSGNFGGSQGYGYDPRGPMSHGFGPMDPRGRPLGAYDPWNSQRQRDQSVSSVSSISSSDSDSSECSLDDLPDYDDVEDGQLPLYATRLEDWVGKPETIRTRQDLTDLKAELKTARRAPLDPALDKKALRKHVKALRQQWKGVRKEQKRVLRERKRERRRRRRGEKREKRERSRDVKRSQREMKRELKEGRRDRKHGSCGERGRGGGPGQWSGPCARPVPGQAMYGRGGGGGGGGGWSSIFGNRGIFGPQGSFGPQVTMSGPSYFPQPHSPHANQPGHEPPQPVQFGAFGPRGGSFTHEPFSNMSGSRPAPPGAWPDDKKSTPGPLNEVKKETPGGDQEDGVMEATGLEDRVKELEQELETKIEALDGLDEGKQRKEGEKEVEALVERLDGLRMEMDERYARELADRG